MRAGPWSKETCLRSCKIATLKMQTLSFRLTFGEIVRQWVPIKLKVAFSLDDDRKKQLKLPRLDGALGAN